MYLPFPEIEDILLDKYKKKAGWVEENDGWCGHCEKYTKQERKYSGHERDSSGDYFICLECDWYCIGHDDWSPP